MNILGISAFYHDSACCLISDGMLIAAAEEERFTRIKHECSMPINAIKYCLDERNLCISDVDCIAYYEDSRLKLERQIAINFESNLLFIHPLKLSPNFAEQYIRDKLGFQKTFISFKHHLSHAASSYFFSGYDRSAILVVDGVGEWDTASFGLAKYNDITISPISQFPNSIGFLYSTLTSFLGFEVNEGEYKVM